MTAIRFGTDGWRAVVGQDFTPENVSQIIQAFADLYPHIKNGPQNGVVIGFDRRNQSPETAELIAGILLANNIPVFFSETFCPTPAVSWYTKNLGAVAGIMVTASHNPPQWNGIKFKEATGGAADGAYVTAIEKQIDHNHAAGKTAKTVEWKNHALLKRFNPLHEYVDAMAKMVDLKAIEARGLKILVEPMFGAGVGFFQKLLPNANITELHSARDLNFGGVHPEPIPPHVNEAIEHMKTGKYDCCVILDGDADRSGFIDENGRFVTTQEIYTLLLQHAAGFKKFPGNLVIKSVSTTQMVDRLCQHFGFKTEMVPVGFKHISPAMTQGNVLMGGEESGGFGFPQHVPERDGILSDLFLLEMMAVTGKSASALVAEVQQKFGPSVYKRNDYKLSTAQISTARERFNKLSFTECLGHKVKEHVKIDGQRFLFDDGSWLLFRASGTEPLIRVYAETASEAQTAAYLQFGKEALGL